MDWRVWQAVSRRLGAYFHLYLLDLRGHGESDKPERGYSLAHYAADVEDVIDLLNLKKVTLVGSSLGAMVAVSVEAPEDVVTRRVLVDPPLTGGPIREEMTFREILRLKHRPEAELAAFLQRNNPKAGRFLLEMMSEMWHRAADGVIQEMLGHPNDYNDVDSALNSIESPTLLLQADPGLGSVLTDADAERTLALLAHGSLIRMHGAGHAIHAYKPREFTEIVRDFAGVEKQPEAEGAEAR